MSRANTHTRLEICFDLWQRYASELEQLFQVASYTATLLPLLRIINYFAIGLLLLCAHSNDWAFVRPFRSVLAP